MTSTTRTLIRWLGGRRGKRLPDLGVREIAVLELLWSGGPGTAQDILEKLSHETISLSTVQSTLERLHRKGILTRGKQGRAYRYEARLSREQTIAAMLRDVADSVAGGKAAPMVSGFMEYVASEAPELESGLARALEDRSRRDD